MDEAANLDDRPAASAGDGGTAALLVFPRRDGDVTEEPHATSTGAAHGSASLFDRLGHLLGLDASIRRWMLVDRLGALIALGVPAREALARLRDIAVREDERASADRAIARLEAGEGLADALAAAGGYPARGLDEVRAATGGPAEAAALNGIALVLRRRLTLRYTAALGGAASALVLAVLVLRHPTTVDPTPLQPVAQRPADAPPAPKPARTAADLAPMLGPGLAGAPPPLVGIVGRLPDDAVALVRMPSGRTRTLSVGAVFDGWTLASLDAEEAVFSRSGQRVTVALPPADDQ